jgi:hypothetical protein
MSVFGILEDMFALALTLEKAFEARHVREHVL